MCDLGISFAKLQSELMNSLNLPSATTGERVERLELETSCLREPVFEFLIRRSLDCVLRRGSFFLSVRRSD
jgi:hypothetical protein